MLRLGLFFEKTQNRNPTENIFIEILFQNFHCTVFDASKIDDYEYTQNFIDNNDIFLPHLFLFRFASKSKKIGNYPFYSQNYNSLIENGEKIIDLLSTISKPVCCLFLRSDWYCESEAFWNCIPKHFFLIGGMQKGFINTTPDKDVFFGKIDINIELGNDRFPDEKLIPIRHLLSNREIQKFSSIKKKYDFSVLGVLYTRRKAIYESIKKSSLYKVYNPKFLLRLRNIFNSLNKKYFFTNRILNYLFNKALAQSKISYTDGTMLNYFIRKYLEIPATNTLLICEPLERMEDYGFIENIHYVSCTPENVTDKVNFLLNNEDKMLEIIKNARQLVKDKYTETYIKIKLQELFDAMHNQNFVKSYYKNGDLIIETNNEK